MKTKNQKKIHLLASKWKKWLSAIPLASLIFLSIPASEVTGDPSENEVQISMLYSNASKGSLPYDIFSKKKWTPDPGARFVKLHIYLDREIPVSKIVVDTCGEQFSSAVTLFVNFNEWIESLEGDQGLYSAPSSFNARLTKGKVIMDNLEQNDHPWYNLRSLTINFEKNRNFSVCGIEFYDSKGKPWAVNAPRLSQGKVKAGDVLAPEKAYGPVNLFDSRFEFGWATDKKESGVSLEFQFQNEEKITALRIWNGYQRSFIHCYSNSRAKELLITGDGGYKAKVKLEDITGSQLVKLPKPFQGKNLKITVDSAYLGKKYKDLVISELRFFDGNRWFMIDPLQKLDADKKENEQLFQKAGLQGLLNDGFTGQSDTSNLQLRLRSDGSFYLSGSSYQPQNETSVYFFALGNYEVKSADSKKGIRLKIFGLLYEAFEELYGDCNGCGRDCNVNEPVGASDSGQKIFSEYITIQKNQEGGYDLVNESGGKKIKIDKAVLEREP